MHGVRRGGAQIRGTPSSRVYALAQHSHTCSKNKRAANRSFTYLGGVVLIRNGEIRRYPMAGRWRLSRCSGGRNSLG